ncbi:hypothetical protein [Streptomyces sp. NPDC051567]|uniref:hypothetical protein n=1 Tax=Streptomyces sp. NPDC051567 TaxID=3365660 RepID=UPI0037A8F0DB
MPAATRCLLLLTVLLAGGVSAATTDTGPGTAAAEHRNVTGTTASTGVRIPTDTSWGDEYLPPLL